MNKTKQRLEAKKRFLRYILMYIPQENRELFVEFYKEMIYEELENHNDRIISALKNCDKND